MIFASFGNSPVPFLRMAKALDLLAEQSGEDIVVQNGKTEYEFRYCKAYPFMGKGEFLHYLQSCEVAVLQGGWGGICEASDLGVRCVVIPRINGIEHHHNQEQLVRALELQGVVIGCYDTRLLPELVEKAKTFEFRPIKHGDASGIINSFINSL